MYLQYVNKGGKHGGKQWSVLFYLNKLMRTGTSNFHTSLLRVLLIHRPFSVHVYKTESLLHSKDIGLCIPLQTRGSSMFLYNSNTYNILHLIVTYVLEKLLSLDVRHYSFVQRKRSLVQLETTNVACFLGMHVLKM